MSIQTRRSYAAGMISTQWRNRRRGCDGRTAGEGGGNLFSATLSIVSLPGIPHLSFFLSPSAHADSVFLFGRRRRRSHKAEEAEDDVD